MLFRSVNGSDAEVTSYSMELSDDASARLATMLASKAKVKKDGNGDPIGPVVSFSGHHVFTEGTGNYSQNSVSLPGQLTTASGSKVTATWLKSHMLQAGAGSTGSGECARMTFRVPASVAPGTVFYVVAYPDQFSVGFTSGSVCCVAPLGWYSAHPMPCTVPLKRWPGEA
mgnify:CR=1 FL=1